MKHLLGKVAAASLLAAVLSSGAVHAAPTETTRAGTTSVRLSDGFLNALSSLNVTPEAIAPGRITETRRGAFASFKITTGAFDRGTTKAEIAHEGGLRLTAGSTVVELSSFVIDLLGNTPVLTGLVVINDSLVPARVPLFKLAPGSVWPGDNVLRVDRVDVRLTKAAADALNDAFQVGAFKEDIQIGTASVTAILEFDH